jgi:hypothetical protein
VRLVLSVVGLAPALLWLGQPDAKPAPIAPWTELTLVDVVPSMVEDYLAIERELTARARDEKIPWRAVSRTEVFGNHYRFVIASPLSSLARFDRKPDPDPRPPPSRSALPAASPGAKPTPCGTFRISRTPFRREKRRA